MHKPRKEGGECILSQIGSLIHHELTQPKNKSHHSPPYGMFYDWWQRLHWNGKKIQEGVFKLPKLYESCNL